MSCTNCGGACDFLCGLISKTEELINALYDAQLAFADPTVVSYTLDTSQTRQVVTRSEGSSIENRINKLLSRYQTLNDLVCGSRSAIYVRHL